MNKIFKYAFAVVAGILALATTSCTSSDDWKMAEKLNGAQVYFPNTLASEVNLPADASTYEIPVMRVNTTGEITVPLAVTYEGTSITFPASVTFADGQNEAKAVINYDIEKLGFDKFESATIAIDNDEYKTIYGLTTYQVSLGVPAPWTSLGKAKVAENFWAEKVFDVEIQQNDIDPQSFRLIKPFPDGDYEQGTEALEFRIYHAGETLKGVTLTQDIVYWDYNTAALTYYDNYDAVITLVWPGTFAKYPTENFWVHNTVLSYQENGLPAVVQFAPNYYMFGKGGWDQTQKDGIFTITFPGVVIKNYSAGIAYSGKFEAADGTISAVADVTLGADVVTAKATVVAGRNKEDAAIAGINAGSLDNIVVADNGEVKIPMPKDAGSGVYTMVVVTYDAKGAEQEYASTTFNYSASGQVAETWTPVFLGTFTYKFVFGNSDGTPYDDKNLVLYESDANKNRYKITNVFNGVDFIFEMDSNDKITFEDQYTGHTDEYGDLMICDMHALHPEDMPTQSYRSNNTFYFNAGYYDNDGIWAWDKSDNNDNLETFTLTANYEASGTKAAKVKGHKVNRKAPKKPATVKNFMVKPVKAAFFN